MLTSTTGRYLNPTQESAREPGLRGNTRHSCPECWQICAYLERDLSMPSIDFSTLKDYQRALGPYSLLLKT